MPSSFTIESKSSAQSVDTESKSVGKTWDEAVETWDEATYTWDGPQEIVSLESKNSATLTNESKN